MKYSKVFNASVVAAVALATWMTAPAGADESNDVGRLAPGMAVHELTLRLGFTSNVGSEVRVATTAVSTTAVSTTANGVLGTVQYNYSVRDEWGVGLSAGVIDSDAEFNIGAGAASSSAATITMFHMDVTYRPAALAPAPVLRPYLTIGAGPYVGSFAGYRASPGRYTGARTSTVFGMRMLVGLDLRFANRFKIGAAGGYHFIGAFEEQVSTATDYSRPELSLGVGMGFGGM